MAIVRCDCCAGRVSDRATRCPTCGGPGPAVLVPALNLASLRVLVDPAARAARSVLAAGLVLAAGVLVVGLVAGGPVGELAQAGLEAAPFVVIGWLAHLGARRRWARWAAWIASALLVALVVLVALVFVVGAYDNVDRLRDQLTVATLAVVVAGVLSMVLLLGPPRRLLSRPLGLDVENPVHQIALFLATSLSFVFLAPLAATGRPVALDLLAREPIDLLESPVDLMLPLAWIIPASFVLVGYGTRRGWTGVVHRLGLRWPGRRALSIGALVGLVLVPLGLVGGELLSTIVAALGLPVTDETQIELLFSATSMTPAIAVAIAVSAGVGEELAVRGVLQPRLGVGLSNAFFALTHAWQYALDGVALVFLLGLVFAVLRRKNGTFSAMAAHAAYDFSICILVLLDAAGS